MSDSLSRGKIPYTGCADMCIHAESDVRPDFDGVGRFQRWAERVEYHSELSVWIEKELPPIDVLMVWHAYTLNPM